MVLRLSFYRGSCVQFKGPKKSPLIVPTANYHHKNMISTSVSALELTPHAQIERRILVTYDIRDLDALTNDLESNGILLHVQVTRSV